MFNIYLIQGLFFFKFTYLLNTVEHRQVQVSFSSLTGGNSTDHVGAILDGLLAVESSLLSCEALTDDFGVAIYH